MFSVYCAVFNAQYVMFSVQRVKFSMDFEVYSVQRVMCIEQCTMFGIFQVTSYWYFLGPELYATFISPVVGELCAIDHG